jgi:phage anti-repressor protein
MTTPIQQPPGDATVAQSTATNQNPSQEATVDARLLRDYIGEMYDYGAWITELRRMCSVSKHSKPGHRVIDSADGKTALSLPFACELALMGGTLAEAIPLIVIVENWHAPEGTVDAQLQRFLPLVVAGDYSAARVLHEFLEVEQGYDEWITGQIKALRMKPDTDYFRMVCGDSQTSWREIMISFRMAQEIALGAKTPRGGQVRQCVESYKQAHAPGNPTRGSNLFQLLQRPASKA